MTLKNQEEQSILVVGGTGHYGQNIVRSLLGMNVKVRLLTRNENNVRRLFADRVEIVKGSIEDREALQKAFSGVDGIVFSISAMSVNQIRRLKQIEQQAVINSMDLAKNAGIKRIVYISVFEVNLEFAAAHRLTVASEKAVVEEYIRNSGFNWTILGAPPSMEIFFAMIHGNNMMVPGGGPSALPTISPVDVGEIAAQAVIRNDLHGLRIKMVGPRAYSFPDAASRISKTWGRTIHFRKIPIFLPRLAYLLSSPFTHFSDRVLYAHTLLGFVRLLNNFPQSYISEIGKLHDKLLSTFAFKASTIEMEAERKMYTQGAKED